LEKDKIQLINYDATKIKHIAKKNLQEKQMRKYRLLRNNIN
jgi:hypothetical protein